MLGLTRHLELSEAEAGEAPHLWAVLPFSLLLAAIAVLPLMEGAAHWWERNLNKFYLAANLALATLLYLAFLHPSGGLGFATHTLLHTVINEYIPFIVLLFSLYTIAGGIRIAGDLPAHPLTNVAFLGVGAVLASFIGTTGAAMLLVRPLLGDQPRAEAGRPHDGLFHLRGLQLRRLAAAVGRSSAVFGLFERRRLFVDAQAVEELAVRQWNVAGGLFFVGPFLRLSARRKARRAHGRNPRPRPAVCRPVAQRRCCCWG